MKNIKRTAFMISSVVVIFVVASKVCFSIFPRTVHKLDSPTQQMTPISSIKTNVPNEIVPLSNINTAQPIIHKFTKDTNLAQFVMRNYGSLFRIKEEEMSFFSDVELTPDKDEKNPSANGAGKMSFVYGDSLYFVTSAYNRTPDEPNRNGINYICKLKLDGSELRTLYQSPYGGNENGRSYQISDIYGIFIKDNFIYFYSDSLKKMTLDGIIVKEYENTIYDFTSKSPFYIYNEHIYYLSAHGDFGYGKYDLYSMDMDGNNVQLLQKSVEEFTINEKEKNIVCIVPDFSTSTDHPEKEGIMVMGLNGADKTMPVKYPLEWAQSGDRVFYRTSLHDITTFEDKVYYTINDETLVQFSSETGARIIANDIGGFKVDNDHLFYVVFSEDNISDIKYYDIYHDTTTQILQGEEVALLGATDDAYITSVRTWVSSCGENDDIPIQLYEVDKKTKKQHLLYDIDDYNGRTTKLASAYSDELLYSTDKLLFFDGFVIERDGSAVYLAEQENGKLTAYHKTKNVPTNSF